MIEDIVANYLRITSCLEIENAKSGHPGICLGAAPIIEAIYKKAFFCPDKPDFIARDRIIFSAGHCSALIYAALNLFNFNITKSDLKNFRKLGSITSGHPETKVTPGIDVSTGPLGQGIANAVGFAIAEEYLRSCFKRENLSPINNYTYCFCGDGCLMEGVALEAISLAGNLALNRLILLYDKNDITIEGKVDLSNGEDIKGKFLSCNWNVLEVKDGNNVKEIENMIEVAKKSSKPTVIIVKTKIGYGSSLEGSNKIHGKPLDKNQIKELRQKLNYFVPDWVVPDEVKAFTKDILLKNKKLEKEYYENLRNYKEKYPKEFEKFLTLNNNFDFNFEDLILQSEERLFDGRQKLHELLNIVGKNMPNFIGGSADLGPSTKVYYDNEDYFSKYNRTSRNLAFGIREHSMGAISNGITLFGPIRAFCSTFFAFENYMTPPIRMSALMKNPVLYLFTHDSFTVGEDGPTHQSVEQIATLRCMPDICVVRPAGWNELLAGFSKYFKDEKPYAILIPRQEINAVKDDYFGALKGAYVIKDYNNFDATIIATGSEVNTAIDVSKMCFENNIKLRVVSMPCVEKFEEQSESYKNAIVNKLKPVFCFEASGDNIWYKYATSENSIFTIKAFGKSASGQDLINHFGFDKVTIFNKIKNFLKNNE